MNNRDYARFVDRDTRQLTRHRANLLAGLGISGEAGEVTDLIKKAEFHGATLYEDELRKELGDVLWYLVLMANANGMTLEEIMEQNVKKLCVRYPDRYGRAEEWTGGSKQQAAQLTQISNDPL